MPLPAAPEARLFYQAASQRLTDAERLLEGGRTTGAVYLAGYGVECMMKALILARLSPAKRARILRSFRGTRGHDLYWLRNQYVGQGGPPYPPLIWDAFQRTAAWTTGLRYEPKATPTAVARRFLRAVRVIQMWADGRL